MSTRQWYGHSSGHLGEEGRTQAGEDGGEGAEADSITGLLQ